MALCVQRVWNENKNGTGAMDTAKNEVFIGFKHEICYVVGAKKSGVFFQLLGRDFSDNPGQSIWVSQRVAKRLDT